MLLNWKQSIRECRDRNKGDCVGSWAERMDCAWQVFSDCASLPESGVQVGDYGCGQQGLRRMLPTGWSYVPYDWISRSQDTRVYDFEQELPGEKLDVIFCLGVFEYMSAPERLLRHLLSHGHWVVFSGFMGWNPWRAWVQGWRGRLSESMIQRSLSDESATLVKRVPWRRDGAIWVCETGVTA